MCEVRVREVRACVRCVFPHFELQYGWRLHFRDPC